ncbi:MAG: mechanosensitive ion channel protein MscS [Blastocatellia bacterium AA13]|nr:MAG: mechanosensitive ion channel protein MscS [Blastocatellia bacterium AA13]
MATDPQAQVERVAKEKSALKEKKDLEAALKQAEKGSEHAVKLPTSEAPAPPKREKVKLAGYVLVLLILAALHYLFILSPFGLSSNSISLLQRFAKGAMLITLLLGLGKASEAYLIARIDDAVSRYNLARIQRLIAGILVILTVVSILFVNWYAAVLSLGLISVILGFALQTPVSSFIGWLYIMARGTYRIGDRIKIGDAAGDVIDVSYLDTTLWEVRGHLSSDQASGRIIKLPNSEVLRSAVYYYTWPLFPYIWDEIKFTIGYESDLDFVAKTLQETVEAEIGETMMSRVRIYRRLLADTPVNAAEVRERPSVLFRINQNTWLDAIVRYLVHPKDASTVKTRLIEKLLGKLASEPNMVSLPKGSSR